MVNLQVAPFPCSVCVWTPQHQPEKLTLPIGTKGETLPAGRSLQHKINHLESSHLQSNILRIRVTFKDQEARISPFSWNRKKMFSHFLTFYLKLFEVQYLDQILNISMFGVDRLNYDQAVVLTCWSPRQLGDLHKTWCCRPEIALLWAKWTCLEPGM